MTQYCTSGSVSVRFELSDLPEHAGTPTLVIRVLKLLEPVKHLIPGYDGSVMVPEEGALVSRTMGVKGSKKRASSWRLDRSPGIALRPFLNEP